MEIGNGIATNELLSPAQLNDIIAKLKEDIPNFPDLNGRTISYDYEAEINIISIDWDSGYCISEDYGYYILDLDRNNGIIGIELFNFILTDYTSKT